jgi:type III pantothenate kinase
MLLAVDAGNTKTKWAVFDSQGQQRCQGACLNGDFADAAFPPTSFEVKLAIVANVAGEQHLGLIEQKLQQQAIPYQIAHAEASACGVLNGYQAPKNLGVDRWAALIAAYHLHQTDCIVVNAGTAMTVDALQMTPDGALFLGGTISPGLRMMQAALVQNTAQLPAESGEYVDFPVTTEDAIYTGCIGAALGLIESQWQRLDKHAKIPPTLLLSGGDATVLAKYLPQHLLKQHIIVDNLVLVGLMHMGLMQLGITPLGREAV